MLSIFDIYKIGVGTSSSHTNDSMIAGYHFTRLIESNLAKVVRIQVDLYGSLSLTGIGHHTDRATILGLLGNKPDTIKIASANKAMCKAIEEGMMSVDGTVMKSNSTTKRICCSTKRTFLCMRMA